MILIDGRLYLIPMFTHRRPRYALALANSYYGDTMKLYCTIFAKRPLCFAQTAPNRVFFFSSTSKKKKKIEEKIKERRTIYFKWNGVHEVKKVIAVGCCFV